MISLLLGNRLALGVSAAVLAAVTFAWWLQTERQQAANAALSEQRSQIERQAQNTEDALRSITGEIEETYDQIEEDHVRAGSDALHDSLRDGSFLTAPLANPTPPTPRQRPIAEGETLQPPNTGEHSR